MSKDATNNPWAWKDQPEWLRYIFEIATNASSKVFKFKRQMGISNAKIKWTKQMSRQTESSWKYFTSDWKMNSFHAVHSRYTVFTNTMLAIWGNVYTPQFSFMLFLLERYCLPKRNVSSTGKTIFPINLRKPKIPNGIKIIFPLPPP